MHDVEYGHSNHHDAEHSPEEVLALLKYMADHTRHHCEELHDLAHSAGGDAERLIHEAVDCFQSGIGKLDDALQKLKEE
ncbi:MAG: hypothetical protein IJ237_07335 [Oscillospiraceae bacterium]|nr:hypothetical protein [Oscillospiraceae bacterium]